MPTDLDAESFDDVQNGDETWVVDFWAEWCGPCQQMKPIFEETADEFDNVNFGKVDIEEQQDLATQNGVRSIPTFIIFEGGEVVDQKMGAMPKDEFQDWIASHA
jgi:thioredoxin